MAYDGVYPRSPFMRLTPVIARARNPQVHRDTPLGDKMGLGDRYLRPISALNGLKACLVEGSLSIFMSNSDGVCTMSIQHPWGHLAAIRVWLQIAVACSIQQSEALV